MPNNDHDELRAQVFALVAAIVLAALLALALAEKLDSKVPYPLHQGANYEHIQTNR